LQAHFIFSNAIASPLKNKKSLQSNARVQCRQSGKHLGLYHDTGRRASDNSTYKKLAVQCSADTFSVNQTSVFRIKFCGENRQLLVAANRYAQCYDDHQTRK